MHLSTKNLKQAGQRTWRNFITAIPIIIGVFLLISFIDALVPKEFYARAFSGIPIVDALVGALIGSISAGHPITSYIIGGELLNQGVSMVAVVAFILCWVTVGVIQLPAESSMLGKKYAILRNGVAFISAIAMAVLIVLTLGIL